MTLIEQCAMCLIALMLKNLGSFRAQSPAFVSDFVLPDSQGQYLTKEKRLFHSS